MGNDGKNMKGEQVVPKKVVRDILNGGTEENLEQIRNAGYTSFCDAYRNQFWVIKKDEVFAQIGVFGQNVYMDVENDVLIVRFASSEVVNQDPAVFQDLYDPIIEYLTTHKSGGGKKKKNKKGNKKKD